MQSKLRRIHGWSHVDRPKRGQHWPKARPDKWAFPLGGETFSPHKPSPGQLPNHDPGLLRHPRTGRNLHQVQRPHQRGSLQSELSQPPSGLKSGTRVHEQFANSTNTQSIPEGKARRGRQNHARHKPVREGPMGCGSSGAPISSTRTPNLTSTELRTCTW